MYSLWDGLTNMLIGDEIPNIILRLEFVGWIVLQEWGTELNWLFESVAISLLSLPKSSTLLDALHTSVPTMQGLKGITKKGGNMNTGRIE